MLHRHHKIPKHMGGSNHPSNIEILTIKASKEKEDGLPTPRK
jgi:hypothetical protein